MDREASSLVTTQNCQLVRQMMHHAAAVLPQDLYVSQDHSYRLSLFVQRDMAGHISALRWWSHKIAAAGGFPSGDRPVAVNPDGSRSRAWIWVDSSGVLIHASATVW